MGADEEKEATLALADAAVLGMTCGVWFEQPATINKTTDTTSTLAFFIDISSSLSSKGLFFLLSRLALLRGSVSLKEGQFCSNGVTQTYSNYGYSWKERV